jgi:hypothetical protein|tara:strand:- start:2105 stop:2311 length:207 start_codon:yes stop_codon:yes gene_type:complete
MIDKLETIKKGTKLITKQLGFPTSAVAMESIKQGRGLKKVLLIDAKGSEIGLYDEMGSIYVSDIVRVL